MSPSFLCKVAVVGASGGIGQPLSLLLKLDPSVKELSLYDIVHTPGVAADLSHIPTPGKAKGYKGTLPNPYFASEPCTIHLEPLSSGKRMLKPDPSALLPLHVPGS